jgi:predicted esterase
MGNATSSFLVATTDRKFCVESCRHFEENASKFNKDLVHDESTIHDPGKRIRYLCLHGYRTSGEILRMQTAAFRAYTQLDCVFVDAPFKARGPPDAAITTFYPDTPYFEWYNKADLDVSLDESLAYLVRFIQEHGPFDGLLGFSQGAAMATQLLDLLSSRNQLSSMRYVILIGGVQPPRQTKVLPLISLHIMGLEDGLLPRSRILASSFLEKDATVDFPRSSHSLTTHLIVMYSRPLSNLQVLQHEEAHNIPSVRTKIYHLVKLWIWENEGYTQKWRTNSPSS